MVLGFVNVNKILTEGGFEPMRGPETVWMLAECILSVCALVSRGSCRLQKHLAITLAETNDAN